MGLAFYGRATRNFLGLLCLMHFVLFLDRINLAAAATTIQKDLGLSNIALGLAFSAFNYSYAPFQMVGGWFADRFGARRTLTVCGLAWSITTIATAAVNGLGSLAALRFVLGMGEGATLPAATRALSNWTPLATRGTAIGITHSAGRVGSAMTAPVVAFLIIWFSWRFSFVALGVVSLVWAALWWRYFHEDPREHPGITSTELAALSAADPGREIAYGPVPWRRLIPRMTPMMIIYFCQGWTGWLFATWMPSLLQKNYGVDLKKSAFLYMAMLFCGFLAELLGGVLTDYLLRRTRQRADRALAADRRQLGSHRDGASAGDPRPQSLCRGGGLHAYVVLHGDSGCAAVDRGDRHRAGLRRHRQRVDECRGRRRRDVVAGRIRRDPPADRELDAAVRGLRRSVAVRHRRDLLDPARPPDRGRAAGRRLGGGRGVDPGASHHASPH